MADDFDDEKIGVLEVVVGTVWCIVVSYVYLLGFILIFEFWRYADGSVWWVLGSWFVFQVLSVCLLFAVLPISRRIKVINSEGVFTVCVGYVAFVALLGLLIDVFGIDVISKENQELLYLHFQSVSGGILGFF